MSQKNIRSPPPADRPTAPEHGSPWANSVCSSLRRTTERRPALLALACARVRQSVEGRTAAAYAPRRAPGAPAWRRSGTLGGAPAPHPFHSALREQPSKMYDGHTLPQALHGLRIMHAANADVEEKGADDLLAGRREARRGTGGWLGLSFGRASAGWRRPPASSSCASAPRGAARVPSRREHFAWEREAGTNRRSSRSQASATTPSRTSGSALNGKVGGPDSVARGIRAQLVCSRRA